MNRTLHIDYWRDTKLKSHFISFLDFIFGLNLTAWDTAGYWDYDNYHPFTYFDDTGNIISHVCMFSLDAVIDGKPAKLGQFSGVATLEEYRRQGLNRELTTIALDRFKIDHDFFFLFSDTNAVAFYQRCGFRPVREHKFVTKISPRPAQSGIYKLNMDDPKDRKRVYELASRRAPVSELWAIQHPKLIMFWCLYGLKNMVHYIPGLDCIVLFAHKNNRIIVYDIIAEQMPTFNQIYPYLSGESSDRAEFLFMVDKLNLENISTEPADEDNNTHLMGECPVEHKPFIIPLTAHA
ncbi:MAG: GNAT family N-acetyltransferase [Candidatus Zixiibacteriota bacterium]